jgi:hypothetical protein
LGRSDDRGSGDLLGCDGFSLSFKDAAGLCSFVGDAVDEGVEDGLFDSRLLSEISFLWAAEEDLL